MKILFEVIQKLVSNGLGFLALFSTNVAHFHPISSFFTVKMLLALHGTFKLYTLSMHAAVSALFSPLPFSDAICSFTAIFLPQVRNRGAVLNPIRKCPLYHNIYIFHTLPIYIQSLKIAIKKLWNFVFLLILNREELKIPSPAALLIAW